MAPHDPDLPRDPDLDELPAELRDHEGPLTITGSDEDGNVYEGTTTATGAGTA